MITLDSNFDTTCSKYFQNTNLSFLYDHIIDWFDAVAFISTPKNKVWIDPLVYNEPSKIFYVGLCIKTCENSYMSHYMSSDQPLTQ